MQFCIREESSQANDEEVSMHRERIGVLEAALKSTKNDLTAAESRLGTERTSMAQEDQRRDAALEMAQQRYRSSEATQAEIVERLRAEHDAALSAQVAATVAQEAQLNAVQAAHAQLEDESLEAIVAAEASAREVVDIAAQRDELKAENANLTFASQTEMREAQDESERLRAALAVAEAKVAAVHGNLRRAGCGEPYQY